MCLIGCTWDLEGCTIYIYIYMHVYIYVYIFIYIYIYIGISYWLFHNRYSLLAIPYWLSPIPIDCLLNAFSGCRRTTKCDVTPERPRSPL